MKLLNFQKCVFLALKTTFSARKFKKITNFLLNSRLEKLNIGGSILDIFRDCENFRALAFRSIRRSIFSALDGFSSSGKLLSCWMTKK